MGTEQKDASISQTFLLVPKSIHFFAVFTLQQSPFNLKDDK